MPVSSVHLSRISPAAILARLALCHVWLAASVGSAPAQAADAVASHPAVDAPMAQGCQATLTVQNVNDSGSGSLRLALVEVCPGGVVNFAPSLAGQTVALSSTLPITQSLTIDGSSLTSNIKISGDSNGDGTPDVQVFNISTGVAATLAHLDILRGGTPFGGGISNGGTLTITQSAIYNSTAVDGGGLANVGTATIISSTVYSNTASGCCGGIYNGGMLTVTNSTVSENQAPFAGGIGTGGNTTIINSTLSDNEATSAHDGGGALADYGNTTIVNSTIVNNTAAAVARSGIWKGDGTLDIANSIVAQNTVTNNVQVDRGTFTSLGYNLTNSGAGTPFTATTDLTDTIPLLGPLADNGGGTLTHALLTGSPALDLIPFGVSGCGTTYTQDQRGVARPYPAGGACDAGAFERQGALVYLPLVRR